MPSGLCEGWAHLGLEMNQRKIGIKEADETLLGLEQMCFNHLKDSFLVLKAPPLKPHYFYWVFSSF